MSDHQTMTETILDIMGVEGPWERVAEYIETELVALRKDKARLDWLDKQKPPGWTQVLFEYDEHGLAAVNFCNEGYDDDSRFYFGDNWREAIDAAMEADDEG